MCKVLRLNLEERRGGFWTGDMVFKDHTDFLNQSQNDLDDPENSIFVTTGRGAVIEYIEKGEYENNVPPTEINEGCIIFLDYDWQKCNLIEEAIRDSVKKYGEDSKFFGKKIIVAHASFKNPSHIKKIVSRAKSFFGQNAKISRMDITNIRVPVFSSESFDDEIVKKFGLKKESDKKGGMSRIYANINRYLWLKAMQEWNKIFKSGFGKILPLFRF